MRRGGRGRRGRSGWKGRRGHRGRHGQRGACEGEGAAGAARAKGRSGAARADGEEGTGGKESRAPRGTVGEEKRNRELSTGHGGRGRVDGGEETGRLAKLAPLAEIATLGAIERRRDGSHASKDQQRPHELTTLSGRADSRLSDSHSGRIKWQQCSTIEHADSRLSESRP